MSLPDVGVPLRSRSVDGAGVRLHVVEAGPADGPLVVLLHGFPEFWYGWRRQIAPLARAGWRVWAPDQRGYNLSAAPPDVAAYDVDRLTDDVLALLDAAGAERARVVGHDWGAIVGWWLAMRDAGRVERLAVLNVPHPLAYRELVLRSPSQAARSWYVAFFQLPGLPERALRRFGARSLVASSAPGTFTPADLDRYRAAWARPGAARGMISWYRAAARRAGRLHPGAPDVRPPALVVWGEDDLALDARLTERSLAYCRDGRLVRLPGVSHWVQHEAADRVNRELLAFLGA